VRQRSQEVHPIGQAKLVRERFELRALGPVPHHYPAQIRHRIAKQPHGPEDIGVALAGDQVRDGDDAPWVAGSRSGRR
jgi:hypothetical protein